MNNDTFGGAGNKTWADYAKAPGAGAPTPATPDVDARLADDVAFLDATQAQLDDMRKAHAEGRRITGVFVSTIANGADSETSSLGLIHNPMSNHDMEALHDAIQARLLGVDIKEFVEGGGMMGALGGLLGGIDLATLADNNDFPSWDSSFLDEGFRDIDSDDLN